jgi:hypothetical protein
VSSAPIDFTSYRSRFVQEGGALILPLLDAPETRSGRTRWQVSGVSTMEDEETGAVAAMRWRICLDRETGFVAVRSACGDTETEYVAAFSPDEDPVTRARRESVMQLLSALLTTGWRLEA